jgi:hypothetical protein
MGLEQPTRKPPWRTTKRRRPRPRLCLRKGCGRRYMPRRWNQRYCQDPECLRLVRRWQSARRQRRRRASPQGRQYHRQAERARRQEAKLNHHKALERPDKRARGHAGRIFSGTLCSRPGCHEPPRTSLRTPASYCSTACQAAVRRVRDRERKWLSRATLAGRIKRGYEYAAARRGRGHDPERDPRPSEGRPPAVGRPLSARAAPGP